MYTSFSSLILSAASVLIPGVPKIPAVITNSTPFSVVENFHSSFSQCGAVHYSDLSWHDDNGKKQQLPSNIRSAKLWLKKIALP